MHQGPPPGTICLNVSFADELAGGFPGAIGETAMLTSRSLDRRQTDALAVSITRPDSRVHAGLVLGAMAPGFAILMIAAALLVALA